MQDLKFSYRFLVPNYADPSEMVSGELFFDPEKCTGCLLCTTICPARSIVMKKRKKGDATTVPRLEEIVPGVTGCVSCGCCVAAATT